MFAGKISFDKSLIILKIFVKSFLPNSRDAKNMARDVHEVLVNVCDKEGKMGRTAALQYVKELGQKSRYVQDVWS